VGTTYLPLPRVVQKDLSVPFPCQGKACDCASADDCWASCCCHNDDEKLAWAAKNGISPPEWFVEGLRRTNPNLVAGVAKTCCSAQRPSCCQAPETQTSASSCCATKRPRSESPEQCAANNRKTQPISVCVKQQRKCKGQDGVLHLDLVFVELTESSLIPDRSKPEFRLFDVPTRTVAIPPPTPPPRRA
jgi:hypothetical protein